MFLGFPVLKTRLGKFVRFYELKATIVTYLNWKFAAVCPTIPLKTPLP